MTDKKNETKPFGLNFLEEVPQAELEKINGGRRRRPTGPGNGGGNGGGFLHTMAISVASSGHPHGDAF